MKYKSRVLLVCILCIFHSIYCQTKIGDLKIKLKLGADLTINVNNHGYIAISNGTITSNNLSLYSPEFKYISNIEIPKQGYFIDRFYGSYSSTDRFILFYPTPAMEQESVDAYVFNLESVKNGKIANVNIANDQSDKLITTFTRKGEFYGLIVNESIGQLKLAKYERGRSFDTIDFPIPSGQLSDFLELKGEISILSNETTPEFRKYKYFDSERYLQLNDVAEKHKIYYDGNKIILTKDNFSQRWDRAEIEIMELNLDDKSYQVKQINIDAGIRSSFNSLYFKNTMFWVQITKENLLLKMYDYETLNLVKEFSYVHDDIIKLMYFSPGMRPVQADIPKNITKSLGKRTPAICVNQETNGHLLLTIGSAYSESTLENLANSHYAANNPGLKINTTGENYIWSLDKQNGKDYINVLINPDTFEPMMVESVTLFEDKVKKYLKELETQYVKVSHQSIINYRGDAILAYYNRKKKTLELIAVE